MMTDLTPAAETALETTDRLILAENSLDPAGLARITADALTGADDGELFLEYMQSERLVFDDGQLKSSGFDISSGYGLRAVAGELSGYAHSGTLTEKSLRRSADVVKAVTAGHSGTLADAPPGTNRQLYTSANPLDGQPFSARVELVQTIEAFARAADPRVVQVSVSLSGSWQAVQIIRADGHRAADVRPRASLYVSVQLEKNGRRESCSASTGGRHGLDIFFDETVWQAAIAKAIRGAEVNLDAVAAPAGDFPIVLSAGWPGVMLHEAVGHGLEGDFNRKKTSAFSELMGEQVAAKGVTVMDDGTLPDEMGSLTIDDEGTPSNANVLIEDGKLVSYMQDRQNARLTGVRPTGNGRRQSFAHQPMPRMTNTYMTGGDHTQAEMIESVKDGILAVNFGGGQVDITSGKFTFQCTEAYRIENGKIGAPVKGATLIGNGPKVMPLISMIGDDMKLAEAGGNCGKGGQWVPVGIGQPSVKVDRITVGGTA